MSLLSGLVAYYKLNETSGTIVDSANGHNSTGGTFTYGAAGKIGKAINIVNSTDYVTLGDASAFDIATNGTLTINAWVYLNASHAFESAIFGNATGPEFYMSNDYGGGSYRLK
jgi:hypothetical protein